MYRFWTAVLEPVLTTLAPRTLLEVGCERGRNTRRLLKFCQRQAAVLHAVDPEPQFEVAAWQAAYGECFVFHRQLSLEALPAIGAVDAALLDGDHNWYTVFHELTGLQRLAQQAGRPLPLIALHDVGWPYARRDAYYDPGRIPPEYRQPYQRAGLDPEADALLENGGLTAHMLHAARPGGPRNGVLTAVEDFIAANPPGSLHFSQVPGFYGLGLLASRERLAGQPALAAALDKIDAALAEPGRLPALEQRRIRLSIATAPRPAQARLPLLAAKAQRRLAEWRLRQALAARLA
jgi:hypothetical protein